MLLLPVATTKTKYEDRSLETWQFDVGIIILIPFFFQLIWPMLGLDGTFWPHVRLRNHLGRPCWANIVHFWRLLYFQHNPSLRPSQKNKKHSILKPKRTPPLQQILQLAVVQLKVNSLLPTFTPQHFFVAGRFWPDFRPHMDTHQKGGCVLRDLSIANPHGLVQWQMHRTISFVPLPEVRVATLSVIQRWLNPNFRFRNATFFLAKPKTANRRGQMPLVHPDLDVHQHGFKTRINLHSLAYAKQEIDNWWEISSALQPTNTCPPKHWKRLQGFVWTNLAANTIFVWILLRFRFFMIYLYHLEFLKCLHRFS